MTEEEEPNQLEIEQVERIVDAFLALANRPDDSELMRWVGGWSPLAINAAALEISNSDEGTAAVFISGIMTGLRMAEQED